MLSVLISSVVAAIFGAALYFTTSLHPAISVVTGLAAFTLIYVLMLKQVMKRVGESMDVVQKDMMDLIKYLLTINGALLVWDLIVLTIRRELNNVSFAQI